MKSASFFAPAMVGLFLMCNISASGEYHILPIGGGKAIEIPLKRFITARDFYRYAFKKKGVRYELLYKQETLADDVVFTDLDPSEPIYLWPKG